MTGEVVVENLRGARITITEDVRGIPGGKLKTVSRNVAEAYKREWRDSVRVEGMEQSEPEPEADEEPEADWADMTAKDLGSAIRGGEFDDVLDEIREHDDRVTVQDAIDSRQS